MATNTFQIIDYIEPAHLEAGEVDYELLCRGFTWQQLKTISHTHRMDMLRELQKREINSNTAPQTTFNNVFEEDKYITAVLQQCKAAFSLIRTLTNDQRSRIRTRIVHLFNRARRLIPRSRTATEQVRRLVNDIWEAKEAWFNYERAQRSQPTQFHDSSDMNISRRQYQNSQLAQQPNQQAVLRPPNQGLDQMANAPTPKPASANNQTAESAQFNARDVLSSTQTPQDDGREAPKIADVDATAPPVNGASRVVIPTTSGPMTYWYNRMAPTHGIPVQNESLNNQGQRDVPQPSTQPRDGAAQSNPVNPQPTTDELVRQLQVQTIASLNRFEQSMMQFMRENGYRNRDEPHQSDASQRSQARQHSHRQRNELHQSDASERSQASRQSNRQRNEPRNSSNNENASRPRQSNRRQTSSSDSESESTAQSRQRQTHSRRQAIRKPLTPNLWGFTFSGDSLSADKKDLSPQAFLRAVEMYRVSEKYSPEDMLNSVVTLLRGDAKNWWMTHAKRIRTYPQFIEEFKGEWYAPDAETTTYIDLVAYKQKQEPVHRYLINFETRASYCEPPLTEKQLVDILKRNLGDDYRKDVDLKDPKTVAEVKNICKRIDRNIEKKAKPARYERNEQKGPNEKFRSRHVFAVECLGTEFDSDAAEDEFSPLEICTLKAFAGDEAQPEEKKAFQCFNCGQVGHVWRKCHTEIKTPFCMGCGKKGIKITECARKLCQDFHREWRRRRDARSGK